RRGDRDPGTRGGSSAARTRCPPPPAVGRSSSGPASPPSVPRAHVRFPTLSANGEILWMLAVHLALTGLPGIAATLVAMRLGVRNVPVLLAIGLVGSGLAAFIAFWAYFADPTIGQAWNWVLLLGSIPSIRIFACRRA